VRVTVVGPPGSVDGTVVLESDLVPDEQREDPAFPADFAAFYRRDFAAVVGLVYGLSGSRPAAEDLAQEAFAAAHRGWDRIGAYDDPGAWVRRVAMNRAVSGVRRRASEARALLRLGGRRELPAPLAEHDERVWRAIRALPARQAQTIALFYVEDRSVAEIAAVLDCAEGTVKTHLHRARHALAVALAVPGEDDEEERS
jgi:RNA polymerase sigma factor (sigma-70 family)